MARKKSDIRTYVAVPELTQDVDGSVIGKSGFFEDDRRSVAYFELHPSINGGLDERKRIIKIPGYVVDVGQKNSLGSMTYKVERIPEEDKPRIENLGRKKGLVGKFEFW